MRQSALLGKGSLFTVDGNKLLIKVQGAPSIVNDMDALELANVIKGLSMQETNSIDLQKIDTIELQSCFSTFGSQSLGQKLANIFDKKVIAYPFSMSKTFEDPKEEWMTKPKIYEPNKLVLADEQHIRNNKFYKDLAGLYQNQKIISAKAERHLNLPKPEYLLIQLIYDAARLILKKINEEDFLELHPEYISHDGRIYPQALMELKSLIRSFTSQEMTQQNFIELIIEILSLSHSSFDLLNQLLSKEEH